MANPGNTEDIESHHASFLRRHIFATDHKIIGIQFLFMGLFFMVIGGLMAMLIRWQLAYPSDPAHPVPILGWFDSLKTGDELTAQGVMTAGFYNRILTLHATVMVFFVIIPLMVGAFGNYLIPLKIGARDMAFPFLNGLSFWWTLPAGAILLAGAFLHGGGAAGGWTSYPPMSAIALAPSTWPAPAAWMVGIAFFGVFAFIAATTLPGKFQILGFLFSIGAAWISQRVVQHIAFDGQSCWFLSLLLLGFSNIGGAINYISTVLTLRCPGMDFFRMPLSVWNICITALLVLFATPVLAADLLMNLLDHHGLTSFFEPTGWMLSGVLQDRAADGDPLLHLHLFWFYSHPAVYIMILPAMGMVSDILPVFARKPLFGYRPMIYASAAIAFLGFIVWGHHMFQSGMNPALGTTFAYSTMLIAVPSGIKVFNWLSTLWGGNIHFTVPMCNALAFVSMFVIGGLSGIFLASTPVDAMVHNTDFIVAHIHYVLFGGSMFGLFAAIYFWYPKMFGRMMNPALGYTHFFLSFIFFNGVFLPMHILGIQGMPRRVANPFFYSSFEHLRELNMIMSHCAFGLGFAQLFFVVNFLGCLICGKRAQANPWRASTLEWNDAPSPPPHGNFDAVPVVRRGPYEYSSPESQEDWIAQTAAVPNIASQQVS